MPDTRASTLRDMPRNARTWRTRRPSSARKSCSSVGRDSMGRILALPAPGNRGLAIALDLQAAGFSVSQCTIFPSSATGVGALRAPPGRPSWPRVGCRGQTLREAAMSPMAVYNAASELLDRNLGDGRGDKPAFIDRQRRITYAELERQTARLANFLGRLGLRREGRVAMVGLDTVDFPVIFPGALRAAGA